MTKNLQRITKHDERSQSSGGQKSEGQRRTFDRVLLGVERPRHGFVDVALNHPAEPEPVLNPPVHELLRSVVALERAARIPAWSVHVFFLGRHGNDGDEESAMDCMHPTSQHTPHNPTHAREEEEEEEEEEEYLC